MRESLIQKERQYGALKEDFFFCTSEVFGKIQSILVQVKQFIFVFVTTLFGTWQITFQTMNCFSPAV